MLIIYKEKIVHLLIEYKSLNLILDSQQLKGIYGYVKPNAIKALHKTSLSVAHKYKMLLLPLPTPSPAVALRK